MKLREACGRARPSVPLQEWYNSNGGLRVKLLTICHDCHKILNEDYTDYTCWPPLVEELRDVAR